MLFVNPDHFILIAFDTPWNSSIALYSVIDNGAILTLAATIDGG